MCAMLWVCDIALWMKRHVQCYEYATQPSGCSTGCRRMLYVTQPNGCSDMCNAVCDIA